MWIKKITPHKDGKLSVAIYSEDQKTFLGTWTILNTKFASNVMNNQFNQLIFRKTDNLKIIRNYKKKPVRIPLKQTSRIHKGKIISKNIYNQVFK